MKPHRTTAITAIIYTKFGAPEVLQLQEVAKPIPKEHEVLIRIYATTVVKEDPDMRRALGFKGECSYETAARSES